MSAAIVAQAKADLLAAGFDLAGNDGAFLITMEAASRIPGAGVLDKPTGNRANYHGQAYAVDTIAFPDGRIVDVLEDGGGTTPRHDTPQWDTSKAPVDPSRFRPAVSVLGVPAPGPTGPPPADPSRAVDLKPVLDELARLRALIQQLVDRPVPSFPVYTGKLTIPFVGERTIVLTPEAAR